MKEENANVNKALSILKNVREKKPLLDNEYQFLKTFVETDLQKYYLNQKKQERLYEDKKKEEEEKANVSDDRRVGEEFSVNLQNLTILAEQTDRKEITHGRNNANSPYSSETESTSTRKYPNKPLINYSSFVVPNKKFLKLSRKPLPFADELKQEKISYPIGVIYDESRLEWYICDKKGSKIIIINNSEEEKGVEIIENRTLPQPSAVCLYKEGESIAILCENKGFSIVEYFTAAKITSVYCDHKNPIYNIKGNLRGLAKTADGNLMALEHGPKRHLKSLQIFKKDVGSARFPIQGAYNPCFIASNKTSVAISDLGSNSVYVYKLDDVDWENISFERLRVITTVHMDVAQLCNESGFAFVAGLQFDVNGHLLIGDALGHTIKLYDQSLTFLHRLSTDFPMPYMSTFFVNRKGKIMILDIKSPTDKLIYAQLGNVKSVEEWNPSRFSRQNNGTLYRPFR